MNKSILLIFLLTLSFSAIRAQQGDSKRAIAFANYLFNTQQYEFAAQEYLKLVYENPENQLLMNRALESFRLNEDLSSGSFFSQEFLKKTGSDFPDFYSEIVKIRILQGRKILNAEPPDENPEELLRYYESLLLDDMLAYNWEGVTTNAEKIQDSKLYPFTRNLPVNSYKSPFLGAAMSTLLPGSGKFYAKRWKDGLTSFLFVGLTGFQSYLAFKKKGKESVYGWISGGLSLGFYLGNIYGSQKAVKTHNAKINETYRENLVNYYFSNY